MSVADTAAGLVATPTEPTAPVAAPRPGAPVRHKAPLRRRRWLKTAAWLVGLAVLGVGGYRVLGARKAAPLPVQTVHVERGSVRDFVTSVAAGRVTARREVTLRSEIAGTVRQVHHRRGDRVAAGEPLFAYDPDDLRDRLRAAEATARVARAQTVQADQSAAVTATTAERAKKLRDVGAGPAAEAETLEGQAAVAARAADAARASVSQALANVELSRSALAKAVVRAPWAGTVLSVGPEVGEVTAPGALLASLADVATLHVDAEIDEADLGRVALGMPADVTFDAFPGERLRGTLTEIAPSVTRDPRGGRSLAVEVELVADPRLRVGMSADVDIIVATREHVLWVPPNAVMGRGASRAVYVVEGGIAKKRDVEVGVSTWEAVEIKAGLAENDQVIITLASAQLTDGAAVAAEPRHAPGAP